MENNSIINDLQNNKIQNIKSNLYTAILIIICLIIGWYISDLSVQKSELENQLTLKQSKLETITNKKNESQAIQYKLNKIQEGSIYAKIRTCINNKVCDGLEDNIIKNLDQIRAYYLISSLGSQTDTQNIQKNILSSLNDTFLKEGDQEVGTIDSISFGNLQNIENNKNLYKLPVDANIIFKTTQDFIQFLLNIEKKLYSSNGFYAKINSINYDFSKNIDQNVNINMDIILYK